MDKKYNMIDNVAGSLATVAGYQVMKKVVRITVFDDIFFKAGYNLISAYVGLWIGGKVREKTREIRTGVQNMNNESWRYDPARTPKYTSETAKSAKVDSQQAKDFEDWTSSVK